MGDVKITCSWYGWQENTLAEEQPPQCMDWQTFIQTKDGQACIWSDIKTSRRSPGEETKSHCNLKQRGGFYSNSRHLTYAPLLLLKSEIGERRLVLRIERLGKMKIRQGGGGGGGRGRRERKQIEIRVRWGRGGGYGDERRKIDVREGQEIITWPQCLSPVWNLLVHSAW